MSGRFDSHIHLFRDGFDSGEGIIAAGVEEYDAARREAGIAGALVVGYEGAPRYLGNNAHVRELAAVHPWIHSLAYLPASLVPTPESFARARRDGHLGVALYLAEPGARLAEWPLDAESLHGSLVSVNAGPTQLAQFGAQLSRLNECTVLVSHLGLPGAVTSLADARERLAPLLELAACPHVVVKVSGLYAIDRRPPHRGAADAVRVLLDAFGAERLLWGSDYSPALGFGTAPEVLSFPQWLADELQPSEQSAIDGGNLWRLIEAV